MLPAGSIVGALYHKLQTQSSTPEDGRNYSPKHVELIEIINKLLFLHLVGCLYCCNRDARSRKHQTIIRPSLKNSEYGVCGANNIHVIWDPIKLTKYIKILQYYKMTGFEPVIYQSFV